MHIEFLVEEPSAEAALNNLLPVVLPLGVTFKIHPFGGKSDLLSKLSARLKAYRKWVPDDWRFVVLLDEDREDCHTLKARLEAAALSAGFATKSSVGHGEKFRVLNRVVVEELESWFFGDVEALTTAYPRVPRSLGNRAGYRDPDTIRGGTWEALERVLRRAGYYLGGLPKIEVARKVSQHMNPERDRSKSFQVFSAGLQQLFR